MSGTLLRSIVLVAAMAPLVASSAGCKKQGETASPEDKAEAIALLDDPGRAELSMPDRVVDALRLEPGWTVADIGAGSGYFSRRMALKVPQGKVVAIDIDADFKAHIEEQREEWGTPNIEPRLAVNEDPLLPAQSVDLVFVSNTFGYLSDAGTYFAAVHASLREPGYVAIVDYRADADCRGDRRCPKEKDRTPQDVVIRILEGAGFVLDRHEDFLPHQYILVFRKATP